MYTPIYHKEKDLDKIAAFMQVYPFALMVTGTDKAPIATHLPMVVDFNKDEKIMRIRGHMAKGNKHWQIAENRESLLVFSEPHAYIPSSVHKAENTVPTWDYIAVHVSGKVKIISTLEEVLDLMELSIRRFGNEADQKDWQQLPEANLERLLKRVTAFEFLVENIDARYKLSQEESEADQRNIKRFLTQSSDANARELASYFNIEKED